MGKVTTRLRCCRRSVDHATIQILLATAMAGLMMAATAQVAHAEPTRTVGIRITHVVCWPHDDDTCLEAFGEGETSTRRCSSRTP
jgi:hypothetical protein